VRELVIDRQMTLLGVQPTLAAKYAGSTEKRVRLKLEEFFAGAPVELHHRPALLNRISKNGKYHPDANDPEYLVYLEAGDHDVETRVRGLHGQHSDLGLARKRRRRERKAGKLRYHWPSRRMRRKRF
jgi:hypothetical protein